MVCYYQCVIYVCHWSTSENRLRSDWFITAEIHNIDLLLVAEWNQWKRYYSGNTESTSTVSLSVLFDTNSVTIFLHLVHCMLQSTAYIYMLYWCLLCWLWQILVLAIILILLHMYLLTLPLFLTFITSVYLVQTTLRFVDRKNHILHVDANNLYVFLWAGAISKPLSHSMPTVAFRLFRNTFGASDPSLSSGFRSILFDIVNKFLFDSGHFVHFRHYLHCVKLLRQLGHDNDDDNNGTD